LEPGDCLFRSIMYSGDGKTLETTLKTPVAVGLG
jgi:hypothetical protein